MTQFFFKENNQFDETDSDSVHFNEILEKVRECKIIEVDQEI